MNHFLTQANAILACPHVRWNPQARQLILVIEGLVKETTRYREALIAIATFGCCNVGDDFCADDPNIHSIADYCTPCFANAHLVPTPTPATSGTHQPDSVTGDAHSQACSFQQPEPTTTIP
jgi:hypothetical protein